jgi:preprotein translocase subunit YajC
MEIALAYFAVLALAFFLLMVRPQRRRAATHRQFVAALSVGDEVITSGGIFGTIRGLADDSVDLEIAPGTVLRIARIAIAQPAAAFTDVEPPSDDPGR